ncbi:MAG: hypothetical protein II931_06130 [Clostridia bacterium]|nr:hypothetical protein [Clostridia bacterium]
MPVVPISVCTLPKKSDAGGKVTQPKKWVCVFPAGVARRWQCGVYSSEKIGRRR